MNSVSWILETPVIKQYEIENLRLGESFRESRAFIYKFKVNPGQIWVVFFLNGNNCPRLFLPKSGAIVEKMYHLLGFQGCC